MDRTMAGFAKMKRKLLLLTGLLVVFLMPLSAFSAVEYDLLPAADSKGRWGYVDARTKKTVIAPQYRKAGFFSYGLAIVAAASGHSGLIDRTGREILPMQYDSVERARLPYVSSEDVPGLFLVRRAQEKGVVRADGSWALPMGPYENITFYKEGYFWFDGSFWINGKTYHPASGYVISQIIKGADAFLIESTSRSTFSMPKKGVMLSDGEILINPQYDKIKFVSAAEKRWVVSKVDSGAMGKLVKAVVTGSDIDMDEKKDMVTFWLMDGNGKEIRKFRGRYHPFVRDGRVSYKSGGEEYEINPLDGDLLVRESDSKTAGKYILFQERGFWGVKSLEGQLLIVPQYVSMDSLGGDLFVARKIEGLDTSGQAPRYEGTMYDENAGVVNIANEVILPFEYGTVSSLRYPDRETAPIMVGKTVPVENGQYNARRYGMADRTGRMIIPPQYLNDFYMNRIGHAGVYREGWHGVIDYTGKVILPLVYRSIFDTSAVDKTKAVYYTAEKDKLWGVYDLSGKEIVPHQYGYIHIREDDIKKGWVKGDDPDRRKRGAYNFLSKVTIPVIYDDVRIYDHVLTTYRRSEGGGSRDEFDILNLKGNPLATYHRLEPLASGRFVAGKDRLYGVLDAKGKVLVPLKYKSLSRAGDELLWAEDDSRNQFLINETGTEYRIRN